MAKVDPMDIDSMWAGDEDEDKKYDKPSYTGSRGGGLYKKSLKALSKEKERNAIRKEYPSLTDELADELIEKRKRNKGMLDWSEELQRAVLTEEYKKAHPEMSDEEIQERVDYQMGGVDVEDYAMPKDNIDELFEMALRKEHPDWSEEQIQEMVNLKDEEEPVTDVPEIETEVVDLPEEDENEKEIIIDGNEDTINPDATIAGDNGPDFKPKDMTDPEIVENQFEDLPDRVTDEEVADTENAATEDANKKEEPKEEQKKTMSDEDALKEAQELAQDELLGFKISGANWEKMSEKQKANAINAYMKNRENQSAEEPKEEPETPVMSDEDALKEAQELAQDELLGFKISGANWQNMTEKQKAEAIKAFKDANKKEDHSTNIDKSETNNYSSYERYPTGLKVTEDALGEVNTIAGGIKDAAHKIGQEGTSSGSISNEVARAVPHYDYRSLFR